MRHWWSDRNNTQNEAEALQLRASRPSTTGTKRKPDSLGMKRAIETLQGVGPVRQDVAQAQAPGDRLRAMVSLSQQLLRSGRTAESGPVVCRGGKNTQPATAVPSAEGPARAGGVGTLQGLSSRSAFDGSTATSVGDPNDLSYFRNGFRLVTNSPRSITFTRPPPTG